MNPYHFKHPEVRAIAFDLAKALADFDTKATAALMSAEQRIAALETTGGSHEVDRTNVAIFKWVLDTVMVRPTEPAPNSVTRLCEVLDAMKPVGTVPGFQDVDADAPLYFAGLSGRL